MISKINNTLIIATLFIISLLTMNLYGVEAASNLRGAQADYNNQKRERRTQADNEGINATATATTITNIDTATTNTTVSNDIVFFPELVGLTGEEAKSELETTYGEDTYDIIIINENSPTTRDIRFKRVRIIVEEETQNVTRIPHSG